MKISTRGWFALGTLAAVALTAGLAANPSLFAQNSAKTPQPRPGQISVDAMGNLLKAIGLNPKRTETRYDFEFKAIYQKEEWDLSMSAVLSEDGQSIWVMAWLDELPRSAADVPRTALLRLLAQNDQLGNGKFFAYISNNRRFVLQRVVANENISTAMFRDVLKDLGSSVVQTYPYWAVDNWKSSASETAQDNASQNRSVISGQGRNLGSPRTPSRSAAGSSGTIRK